MVSFVI
jgi:hypothetical protein